jgi:hypothetical protein
MPMAQRRRVRVTGRLLAIAAISAAITATAVAASPHRDAERRALAHHSALWNNQHIEDYSFRLRITCFCPPREAVITVRKGRPQGANSALEQLDTIPKMFAAIRSALHDPRAGEVTVSYNRHFGFPRRASIDRIKNAADDEIGWTADHFHRLHKR